MFGFIDLLSCAILIVFFAVLIQYCTGFSFGKHFTKFSRRVGINTGGEDFYGWYGDYAPGSYATNSSNDIVERYQLLCHQFAMARRRIEILQTEIQDLDEENQRLYNANVRMRKHHKRVLERRMQSAEETLRKAGLRSA